MNGYGSLPFNHLLLWPIRVARIGCYEVNGFVKEGPEKGLRVRVLTFHPDGPSGLVTFTPNLLPLERLGDDGDGNRIRHHLLDDPPCPLDGGVCTRDVPRWTSGVWRGGVQPKCNQSATNSATEKPLRQLIPLDFC